MKRKFYIVILLALVPALANALGLGNLDLNSALNEPFDARIQLLSPTADELDSLTVNLADSEAFARAKLDRPFILSKLKFSLRRAVDDGPDYIRVYSQDSIREPFLNFLVEVSWSNGRLFREYTVLLNPPLYDPNARDGEFTRSQPSSEAMAEPAEKVIYTDDFEQPVSSVTSPNVNYSAGDYGPTSDSDTLWSIASAMRSDSSTSVNQMMLALLRANPDAFLNQNINGLKRGQILRMPNESELIALSNAEALADVQSQHAVWDNIKDNLSGAVSERPEISSVPDSTATDTDAETVEADAELKLVAADDTDEATQQVSSVDSGVGDDLALAQESIQALTRENMELKDQLQESEALLDDLKRLLSLKDDELAALQEQAITSEGMTEEVESIVDETMTDVDSAAVAEVEEGIEEAIDDQAVVEDADEMIADEAETLEVVEEEVIDVIESEPTANSDGIMGMVDQYLGPVKEILFGNPMVGMAIAAVLIVLIIIIVIMKFKKDSAETIDIDAMTEEAFPDFDSTDLGDADDEMPDSEAVTVLPDADAEAEAETIIKDVAGSDAEMQVADEDDTPAQGTPVQAAPVEEESDEDPLQEVNTYLAFEQFDQAEEFVRNVIKDDPENPEYHTKLLEVFYTSGNKKSYEDEAKVLHEILGGEGEHWNMAVAMWQEMSPSRALFEAGDDDEDDAAADTTGGGFVDVTAATGAGADISELLDLEIEDNDESISNEKGEAGDDNATVEFDLGDASDSDESTDDDNLLDFDLSINEEDDAAPEIETSEDDADDAGLEIDLAVPELESASSETDDNALDMSLEIQEDDASIELDIEEDNAGTEADDEISLDFDMTADGDGETDLSIESSEDISSDSEMDIEFNLDDDSESSEDDISLDFDGTVEIPKSVDLDEDDDDDDEHTVFVPRASQPDEQSADDEIATKLDLAKAYVELGDKDSAKVILDEVMADGNDEQRKQAEDLLGQV